MRALLPRVGLVVALVVAVVAPAGAAVAVAPPEPTPPSTANPFLPEDANVGDCLSALPPPECGSEERGGTPQLLAFGAMLLGMVFIGWRIARGIRRRERALSSDA